MNDDRPHQPQHQPQPQPQAQAQAQAQHQAQPRGLGTVAYSGLAIAGLAAMALVAGATATPHAEAASTARLGRPVSGTKAESLKLARKLLGEVRLPSGTHRFRGRRLPPGIRHPADTLSAKTLVDVHRAFAETKSMKETIKFLDHHHPSGWRQVGSGSESRLVDGKEVVTGENVTYSPRKLAPQYSTIEMTIEVAPGHHGHAFARADIEVIWFPARAAAEHLTASHFKSVTIDEWLYGKKSRHFRKTFKQQAIIAKLTRVLNGENASPGGIVSCPAELVTYELTFKPTKGHQNATVSAVGCFQYGITVGGHTEPPLVDNGKVESIAHHLMRKHGHQVHPGGTSPKSP